MQKASVYGAVRSTNILKSGGIFYNKGGIKEWSVREDKILEMVQPGSHAKKAYRKGRNDQLSNVLRV